MSFSGVVGVQAMKGWLEKSSLGQLSKASSGELKARYSASLHLQSQGETKRNAIVAEATDHATFSDIAILPKTAAQLRLLGKATAKSLLFEDMNPSARQAVFNSMTPLVVEAGTDIIQQGEQGADEFYVLERGCCEVWVQSSEPGSKPCKVHSYSGCSGFGELAMLYSAPRAATVRAVTECRLWVMKRQVYLTIKRTCAEQERRAIVAEAMEEVSFRSGAVVCRQGDSADRFYIIKSGVAVVSTGAGPDRAVQARLKAGGYFGERALVKGEPRAADVTAEGELQCFTLQRQVFMDLLGPIQDVWRLEALRKVPMLCNLKERQLVKLAQQMRAESFTAGQLIFAQGDTGDTFYVVAQGTLSVSDGRGRELVRLGAGSCFGEAALLRPDVRAANVRAVTDAGAMVLHRNDLNCLLGPLTDIRHMWRLNALEAVPLLAGLTATQKSQLCSALTPLRHIPAGTVLVRHGEPSEALYLVESGTCQVLGASNQTLDHSSARPGSRPPSQSYFGTVLSPASNSGQSRAASIEAGLRKEVGRLGAGMCFGELALLSSEPRPATVKAVSNTDLLALSRTDFQRLLGPLQNLLTDHAAKYCPTTTVSQTVRLEDVELGRVLGAGSMGQVHLVRYAGQPYALKSMSKAQLVRERLQEHVKRERQVLAVCRCPFIVNLVTALQDATHVHLLMECVRGGELFTHLQHHKRTGLSEDAARFYAAAVVLALKYLNDRDIMWRDLKPENLLLDTNGYLKITDFGFAKKLVPGHRTFTLCGTPDYLAPEIVTQTGHAHAVDWWALGVLLFEMCAGQPPFVHPDQVQMFKNITAARFTFPKHFSEELQDLITRLLQRNPAQRLGVQLGGAAEVQAHPWFAKHLDWAAFNDRRLAAPFIPQVENIPDMYSSNQSPSAQQKSGLQRYQSTGIFRDF